MDPRGKPSKSPPSGDEGLDFELTDFAEARRILDNESISQFEVATIVPQEQWQRRRRHQLPTDRALTGHAIEWMTSLPPKLRPEQLSRQFPRITNALAEVWDDPQACQEALNRLVCDVRKGRKGFPRAVRDELVALSHWTQLF